MQYDWNSMRKEDRVTLGLAELFEGYGYRKYSAARFEEYSFYSDNRAFLSDEGIIAFNNSDGKLMALKPDVTLSIVRNAKIARDSFTRVYYNENVFRMSKSTHDYKEVRQSGVEMLGAIDGYAVAEMVALALRSLALIDEKYILTVSHMAFVSSLLAAVRADAETKKTITACLRSKNTYDLYRICENAGIARETTDALARLISLSGGFDEVLAALRQMFPAGEAAVATEELSSLYLALLAMGADCSAIRWDFSVINEIDYYNGIVFQGYAEKMPSPVLAGGRYDRLAEKIRCGIGAIGFAVYLDNLNLYYPEEREYDADVLLLYDGTVADEAVCAAVAGFASRGLRVRAEHHAPDGFHARQTFRFENGEAKEVAQC